MSWSNSCNNYLLSPWLKLSSKLNTYEVSLHLLNLNFDRVKGLAKHFALFLDRKGHGCGSCRQRWGLWGGDTGRRCQRSSTNFDASSCLAALGAIISQQNSHMPPNVFRLPSSPSCLVFRHQRYWRGGREGGRIFRAPFRLLFSRHMILRGGHEVNSCKSNPACSRITSQQGPFKQYSIGLCVILKALLFTLPRSAQVLWSTRHRTTTEEK